MNLFPDRAYVRLRSEVYGTYLHADEDGVSVCLNPLRASRNAAWRVHRIVRNNVPFVLLYGAAYGRYLAATRDPAPGGLLGHRVVQGIYDNLEDSAVVWIPVRVDLSNVILLRHSYCNRLLRANGKYFKWRRTGVSVDTFFHRGPLMHWVVEAIPPLAALPIFPPPTTDTAHVGPRRGIIALFRRSTEPTTEQRTIRYVLADANGNFNSQNWAMFQFHGRSAYNLRTALTRNAGNHFFFFHVTLCAQPGRYARLTPLISHLPRNQAPMDVIVVTNGTPAEVELQYPDVDAA